MSDLDFTTRNAAQLLAPLRSVYCLYGENDQRKDDAFARLHEQIVDPALVGFDDDKLDATSHTPDAILSSLLTCAIASQVRLVLVTSAEVYRKREKSQEAAALARAVGTLPPGCCLVLRAGMAAEDSARTKSVLGAKLDAVVRETGLMVHCGPLTEAEHEAWIDTWVKSVGSSIAPAAVRRLLQGGSRDQSNLERELEKLVALAGPGFEITRTHVEAACARDAEDVMFRLVDAIGNRDCQRALDLLGEALRYENKPQSCAGKLLALIWRQLRLLWQVTELRTLGYNPTRPRSLSADVANLLPADAGISAMAWKAVELDRAGRHWTRPELQYAFELLARCDAANKGSDDGMEDVTANLEILVVRLCGAV